MAEDFKQKWRAAMIAKYGSEEALSKHMSENAKKASRPGTGGFAHMKVSDPERLKNIGKTKGRGMKNDI